MEEKLEKAKDSLIKRLKGFFAGKAGVYGFQIVLLYGSWASGFPKKDSDVDLAILFEDERQSESSIFDTMSEIALALSKEIRAEVNIIPIYRDFRKPMLYYNAIVLGTPVYIKDYGKFLTLRNEAIYQMEDFGIFGKEWQLIVARKNLLVVENARV